MLTHLEDKVSSVDIFGKWFLWFHSPMNSSYNLPVTYLCCVDHLGPPTTSPLFTYLKSLYLCCVGHLGPPSTSPVFTYLKSLYLCCVGHLGPPSTSLYLHISSPCIYAVWAIWALHPHPCIYTTQVPVFMLCGPFGPSIHIPCIYISQVHVFMLCGPFGSSIHIPCIYISQVHTHNPCITNFTHGHDHHSHISFLWAYSSRNGCDLYIHISGVLCMKMFFGVTIFMYYRYTCVVYLHHRKQTKEGNCSDACEA